MAAYNLVMPKMGESIMEATILKWVKNVGDKVEIDDTILEIATGQSRFGNPVTGQWDTGGDSLPGRGRGGNR